MMEKDNPMDQTPKQAIRLQGVQKSYEEVQALRDISLDIASGELFGLIGPDGAGKTTLIRILNSLLVADEGTVEVLGLDPHHQYRQLRPLLGYMPGRFSLYPDLSVKENLEFFASIFGVDPAEQYELIQPIFEQLEPFQDRRAEALSGGMKQKLALSCALIHKPKLLLLDEPTTGVDAVSRGEFWDMLHHLSELGITIVVSTPYMDEAAQCDRVALLDEGQILSIDTPDGVTGQFERPLYAVSGTNQYQMLQHLRTYPGIHSAHPFGSSVHVTLDNDQVDDLEAYLQEAEMDVRIQSIKAGIEDQFMALMGEKDHVR
ncbi:MAG: ABC transporter ATP-binding protein [Bacteroidota bacterium]